MLILRVVANQPLHGYAIAQRIHQLSNEELSVEEGSLYPALQKLLEVRNKLRDLASTAERIDGAEDLFSEILKDAEKIKKLGGGDKPA